MRGRGKGRELSCKLQNNAKIKPQIKWVRIYISLPEEKSLWENGKVRLTQRN